MERIQTKNGTTLGWLIRGGFYPKGVNFIPDEKNPLQLGVSTYQAGAEVKAHMHIPHTYGGEGSGEIIHIDTGRVILSAYDSDWKFVNSFDLHTGDTIFLISGGHEFQFMEYTRIIEVKLGPYQGKERDKRYKE